jgi:hypothetical protein
VAGVLAAGFGAYLAVSGTGSPPPEMLKCL